MNASDFHFISLPCLGSDWDSWTCMGALISYIHSLPSHLACQLALSESFDRNVSQRAETSVGTRRMNYSI